MHEHLSKRKKMYEKNYINNRIYREQKGEKMEEYNLKVKYD